jgi:Ca2+-binding EF-hand superfamily protein
MRSLWPVAVVLALATVCLVPAADPKQSDAAIEGDEEHVVVVRPNRPYHFCLHLQAEGRPFRADWNDVVAQLFRFLDADGDGILSPKETQLAPSVEQFAQMQRGDPLEPDGPPDFGADAAKLTLERFRAHHRHVGGSLQVNVTELNGGKELTDTVFGALDRNRDGRLARDELSTAVEALTRLDGNSDELVTLAEIALLSGPVSLVAVGRPANPKAALPIFVVPGGETDTSWAGTLVKEYDRDRDNKLDRDEAGFDRKVFDRLDGDRDGKLTAAELAGWFKEPPDLEVVVEMGRLSARDGRAFLVGPPGVKLERSRPGVVLLPLDDSRIDLTAVGETGLPGLRDQPGTGSFAGFDSNRDGYIDAREAGRMINSPMVAMMRLADRDGDDKLSEKEFTAGVALHRRLTSSAAAMEFADHGRSLFDFLDADQDSRLGLRELKSAWERLRAWDRNRDGVIVREEIPHQFRMTVSRSKPQVQSQGGMMAMGSPRTAGNRVQRTAGPLWFRKMDRNNDGDVSPREFLGRAEDFVRIDADSDGLLDPAEADRADAAARKK